MLHKVKISVLISLLTISCLKADEFSHEETLNSDLSDQVLKIKNHLKVIKNEITNNYENEKLLWQLETLESWYQDEQHLKCSTDLSYIFKGWSLMQKRLEGAENFYRNWSDYKQGFGNKHQEYFMGLEHLHELSNKDPLELLIILGDHDNKMVYAKYNNFVVGSEKEDYVLKDLGAYSGTAGDALTAQVGKKFTTMDRDNDNSKLYNCAKLWRSAWWFDYCHQSHLNGPYMKNAVSENGEKGIVWDLWRGLNYSLKFVLMLVRSQTLDVKVTENAIK